MIEALADRIARAVQTCRGCELNRVLILPDAIKLPGSEQLHSLQELDRAVAMQFENPNRVCFGLVLVFAGGVVASMRSEDRAWGHLIEVLDRHPRKILRSNEWMLCLLGSRDPETTVEVIASKGDV